MKKNKFPYIWNLADGYPASGIEPHGHKVFSCFACGGGSTMGYKMAGFDVLGCNEIDPEMMGSYRLNHKPKLSYLEPIQEFKTRADLPDELFNLDILDGSPPCSSFSMAGNREKDWGKKKKFREGQVDQVLDDLFFHFIDVAKLLQPKVIIAENVKGMLLGNAKVYVKKVAKGFRDIGYSVQLFKLNAATMGVPQRRERIFFIANRLKFDPIKIAFNEQSIPFGRVEREMGVSLGKGLTKSMLELWVKVRPGKAFSTAHPTGNFFNAAKVHPDRVIPTITASGGAAAITHHDKPNRLSDEHLAACSTFPQDYQYSKAGTEYTVGMSVPPVMMAQVAHQVYLQWLK